MKILIACGGTGGHVFPAITLADNITKDYPRAEIIFAGVFKNNILQILKKKLYRVEEINSAVMPDNVSALFLPFAFKAFKSIMAARGILRNFQPGVVVSMGSFSGGPFAFAAKLMGIPVIIHEQNILPGRANRLSARFADKIAVSFEKTRDFFPASQKEKIVFTGNPVRPDILGIDRNEALRFFGFSPDKFTIIVMGGSQGSRAVNNAFIETARMLDKRSFQVIHLTGQADYEALINRYSQIGLNNKAFAFFENMGQAYAVSDLVISRAGAISIAEITALGLPAILIPYPYAGAHQKENAGILAGRGAAIVIEEENLTKEQLFETIIKISSDKEKLNEMRDASKKLAKPEAAESLKREVLSLCQEQY